MLAAVVEDAVEVLGVIIGVVLVGDEETAHLATLEDDLLEADLTAQLAEGDHAEEFLSLGRDRSEAVNHALTVGFDFLLGGEAVELLIESDTLRALRDVALAEADVEVRVEGAFVGDVLAILQLVAEEGAELVGLEVLDGLLEDLLVGFVAEFGDEA